jgi:hypothetical protein
MAATLNQVVVAVHPAAFERCGGCCHRVPMPSSAPNCAQKSGSDRHAPSSQRGGQGFESPQLHRPNHRRAGEGPLPTRASSADVVGWWRNRKLVRTWARTVAAVSSEVAATGTSTPGVGLQQARHRQKITVGAVGPLPTRQGLRAPFSVSKIQRA